MAEKQGIDWSSLWKKDEWLAVWIGFLIIILLLAGVKIKSPSFRWTTGGEFDSLVAENIPALGALAKGAVEKGEKELAAQVEAVQKRDQQCGG